MAELNALLDPKQRRQLEMEVETLAQSGYGEADIVDYLEGFKEGYSTHSPAGYLGKVASGAMLGYADEAKGAVRSMFTDKSRLYETARARGQLARASNESPIISGGLELAGSVAPGALTGLGTIAAMGRAAGVGGNMLRGAVAGAVEGGAYASGNEVGGLTERSAAAIPGALAGGAVGGAAAPVGEMALAGARRVGAAVSGKGADAQARRALRQAIEETPGTSAASVGATMRQAQGDGVPLTMAEAAGQQSVDLLEASAQAPGPGRAQIMAQIGGRQKEQPRRLLDTLTNRTGVNEGSLDKTLAVADARRAAAGPNYAALGGVDTPDNILANVRLMLSSKPGRAAYQRAAAAAEQARIRGEPAGTLPPFDDIMNGAKLTAGETDTILQGFEAFAEKRMQPGRVPGTLTDSKDSLPYSETARWLRQQLTDGVPEFAKARSEYHGPSELIAAVKQGDSMDRMDLDTFRTMWQRASATQQEGYRIGLINALKADLQNFSAGETADASAAMARRMGLREKLRLVAGTEADALLRAIDTEQLTSRTASQTLGGPATARRMAAGEALGDEPMQNVPTSTQGVISRVLGKLDEWAQRRTRDAVARLGLTTDPDAAERLVTEILSAPPTRPRGSFPGAMVGGPAGALAGGIMSEDRR